MDVDADRNKTLREHWLEPLISLDVAPKQRTTNVAVSVTPPEKETAYKTLLNAAPDLVFRMKTDGTCIGSRTPRALKSSATGRGFAAKKEHNVFPIEVAGEALRLVRLSVRTSEPHTFQYQLWTDGVLREYEARFIPAGEDDVVALVYDVSKRRRLEEQILQSQKMEAVGHLAGGVAHDFNNLLTAILGHCQLGMRSQDHGGGLSASLKEIQKAAEQGAGLCRQLLVFSRGRRPESRIASPSVVVLDLDEILRCLLGEDIEMVARPRPDLGLAKIESDKLEQVLLNLALNARDAMPNGGRLTIETANVTIDEEPAGRNSGVSPGEYVMLSITDTGTGRYLQKMCKQSGGVPSV